MLIQIISYFIISFFCLSLHKVCTKGVFYRCTVLPEMLMPLTNIGNVIILFIYKKENTLKNVFIISLDTLFYYLQENVTCNQEKTMYGLEKITFKSKFARGMKKPGLEWISTWNITFSHCRVALFNLCSFFSFPYQFLPENQEIRHCKNNFVKSTVYWRKASSWTL